MKLSAKQHVILERPAAALSPLTLKVKGRCKVLNCFLVQGAKWSYCVAGLNGKKLYRRRCSWCVQVSDAPCWPSVEKQSVQKWRRED